MKTFKNFLEAKDSNTRLKSGDKHPFVAHADVSGKNNPKCRTIIHEDKIYYGFDELKTATGLSRYKYLRYHAN